LSPATRVDSPRFPHVQLPVELDQEFEPFAGALSASALPLSPGLEENRSEDLKANNEDNTSSTGYPRQYRAKEKGDMHASNVSYSFNNPHYPPSLEKMSGENNCPRKQPSQR
jgi:hypothetical protein